MLLLAAQDRAKRERQTEETLASMPVTMILPTMPTNNAILAQEKLHRTPCSRTHLGDAPLASLWPFMAHSTDRYRCTIDRQELRGLCHFPEACCDGRMSQLLGASWPTNNGSRTFPDCRGRRHTALSGVWPRAKLPGQCPCSSADRNDRWRDGKLYPAISRLFGSRQKVL